MATNNHIIVEFTPEQEQVFIGTMFGDGNLHRKGGTQNAFFQTVCSDRDREYILWKYKILKSSNIFLRSPYLRPEIRGFGSHPKWHLCSRHLPLLTEYNQLFYPNGKKSASLGMLDRLSSLGLAVWYMDDGCSRSDQPTVILSTQGFPYEENLVIRDWFKEKFGLPFRVQPHHHGKYYRLVLGRKENVNRFLKLTRPYAQPCMARKFKEVLSEQL